MLYPKYIKKLQPDGSYASAMISTVGTLKNVTVVDRENSGMVKSVKIKGSKCTVLVESVTAAKILEPVLRQIEKGLKYNDIQVMRDAAKYKMFHDTEIDNIDEKIKQLESGTGFWSYFSYSPTEEQKKEIQKLKEQKNKLMK